MNTITTSSFSSTSSFPSFVAAFFAVQTRPAIQVNAMFTREERLEASKLPELMANTIKECGDRNRKHGLDSYTITKKELLESNLLKVGDSYDGGYLYDGQKGVVINGVDMPVSRHFVKDYDHSGTTEQTIQAIAEIARQGRLESFYSSWSTCNDRGFCDIKKEGDTYRVTTYSSSQEEWENQGVFLYPGIRNDVARELGIEVTEDFHRIFDEGVKYLYENL